MNKQQSISTIFLDTGKNFNKDEILNVPLNKCHSKFEVIVKVPSDVKSIRFDPFEGYGCVITDLRIKKDGNIINYSGTNATEVDGNLFFANLDPQITINFNDSIVYTVVISGKIYQIEPGDLSILSRYVNAILKRKRIKVIFKVFGLYIFCLKIIIHLLHFGKNYDYTESIIFLNSGNGFNLNEILTAKLNKLDSQFCLVVQIAHNIKNIRFDPFEGFSCVISDLRITADGNLINYTDTNAIKIERFMLFNNLDPQIAIDFNNSVVSTIIISGKIYIITRSNIEKLIKYHSFFNEIIRKNIIINKLIMIFFGFFIFSRSIKKLTDDGILFSFKNRKFNKAVIYRKKEVLSYSPPQFDDQISKSVLFKGTAYDQYAVRLKNAVFYGKSNIIVWNKRVIYDLPFYDKEHRFNYTDPQIIKVKRKKITFLRKQKKVIDKAIWMGGGASYNYYHLMYEFAIKFLWLKNLNINTDVPIFTDQICFEIPQYMELLNIMNQNKYKIMPAHPDCCYLANELYYINCPHIIPPNYINDNDVRVEDVQFDVSMLNELRNFLLPYASKTKFPDKIFISRKNASGLRKFNEDEVIELFDDLGFEVVYPEKLSIIDQITMFHHAKIIAGGSGAALTNILFCNDQCKCIVLIKTRINISIFSTIANTVGVDLRYITEEATTGMNKLQGLHDPFKIDISHLKKQLYSWNINV